MQKNNESINNNLASRNTSQRNIMNTDTLEIFNNSDEWASQLKHALSQGENLALLHGLTLISLIEYMHMHSTTMKKVI